MIIKLPDILSSIRKRKLQLGIVDTTERTERMRNNGLRRSLRKREMLNRIGERTREAGLEPVKAYF